MHIGYFTQELDAALAYDAAAREALRGICPHKPSPEIACIGDTPRPLLRQSTRVTPLE